MAANGCAEALAPKLNTGGGVGCDACCPNMGVLNVGAATDDPKGVEVVPPKGEGVAAAPKAGAVGCGVDTPKGVEAAVPKLGVLLTADDADDAPKGTEGFPPKTEELGVPEVKADGPADTVPNAGADEKEEPDEGAEVNVLGAAVVPN